MNNSYIPCRFLIKSDVDTFYITSRDKESKTWVVENCGHVLSKELLQFVYEPVLSSRTEDFVSDTRFNSPDQAYECYVKYINRFI